MPEDDRAGLLLELRVEHFQQPLGGLLLAQPAQLVQRLPLQVEQLGQFLLAAVGVLDPLGQLALGALDDLLLLAELLGLLFQGVLALVEQALALVQLVAELAQFLLALGLLLEGQFLDFQLGLAAAVVDLLLGLVDDLPASDSASRRRSRSSSRSNRKVMADASRATKTTMNASVSMASFLSIGSKSRALWSRIPPASSAAGPAKSARARRRGPPRGNRTRSTSDPRPRSSRLTRPKYRGDVPRLFQPCRRVELPGSSDTLSAGGHPPAVCARFDGMVATQGTPVRPCKRSRTRRSQGWRNPP